MRNIKLWHLVFIAFGFIISCQQNDQNIATKQEIISEDSLHSVNEAFSEAKQIIYSLPSPQEVSLILLDNKDITFDPTLMNDYKNADKYTSDLSKALNLGIYSADISYATIFEQNQLTVEYMNAAKKLADELGILDYFTEEDIEQIEKNVTNRDEVMRILTEAYMKSDAKLQEDRRDDIGALILIGGWIEGMYIATNLVKCNVTYNPKLISTIMEQQLSLSLLVEFLNYYQNNSMLSEISKDIFTLDSLFQTVDFEHDEEGNIIVKEQDFKKICEQLRKIRENYVTLI